MKLRKILDDWKVYNYKYITKNDQISKNPNSADVNLVIDYTRNGDNIHEEYKINLMENSKNLVEDLNKFLAECDNTFYRKLLKHIQQNWNSIENNPVNPPFHQPIDIAYHHPTINSSNNKLISHSTIIIAEGTYNGSELKSIDENINSQERTMRNISLVAWKDI